jgi:hypothetical protein
MGKKLESSNLSSSELKGALRDLLHPWFQSISEPEKTQEETLRGLLQEYSKTEYGKRYNARSIVSIHEFQRDFPITNYEKLIPDIEKVRQGNYSSLLPEPVAGWVMTRGTTGRSKVIPTTETFLSQIFSCGARAIVNFALKKDISVLNSHVLNLNFPSEVFAFDDKYQRSKLKYGYSSGTYAKTFPTLDNTGLLPLQEEIDALGGGVTQADWEKRFDLVFKRTKDANVGCTMGVAPVILSFAHYVKRRYGVLPRDIWKLKALFLTSVAKIHSKYKGMMRHYYGENVPIVEMYTATEGVFAQQIDDLPYVVPNYDTYLFELKSRNGEVKLLADMRKKEWGSLVVSSVLFPRYEIGDLVEAVGNGYFRIFGRKKTLTILEHLIYNTLF